MCLKYYAFQIHRVTPKTMRPTFDWTVLSLWMERGGGSQSTLSDLPFLSSAGTLDKPH